MWCIYTFLIPFILNRKGWNWYTSPNINSVVKWNVKRWVRRAACKHYCVVWDMTCYSVVERYEFSQTNLLHPRQSTLKMEAPVVYRITVPIYYATWHHMPQHHNAESPPWEPQIYIPNYVTMHDIWGSLWGMRYNMWGSHSAVHWREFSLLRCDIVSLSLHFQHSAGPWCLHCEGWTVQVESSTLKTEDLQLLKISANTHTMTLHHMRHYIPADHNLDTKQVLLVT
jgi:hypothetical protein